MVPEMPHAWWRGESLANMTSASIPVNLDRCATQITGDHVALVGLGPEPSCTVVLLERTSAGQVRPGRTGRQPSDRRRSVRHSGLGTLIV